MENSCRVYRPRKPRDSPLFQLVERHLEELLRVWPSRFARQHGPLRAVVERVLREFLRCGLLEHGFARLWCSECRRSVLVASLSGTHADLSFFGMTDEDRFCGVTSPGGIAKIFIGNAATSIEVDHLQYGLEPVTEPATLGLLGLGVVALISRRRT